jgi:hypothetical protein
VSQEFLRSVLEAHLVGAEKGKTIGTYEVADIGEKARTLKGEAKGVETYTKDQRRILMEELQLAGVEQKNIATFFPKDGERVRLTQGIKSGAGADIPPGEYTYKIIGGKTALAPIDGSQPYGVDILKASKFLQPNAVPAAPVAVPKQTIISPPPPPKKVTQQAPAAPVEKPAGSAPAKPAQKVPTEEIYDVVEELKTTAVTPANAYKFIRSLKLGSTGADVKALQMFLNARNFIVSLTGIGSKGNESSYFGPATQAAVSKFQEFYAKEILLQIGLLRGTGFFGPATIQKANSLQGIK